MRPLSIRPVEKWQDVLFFFLSTRMLPVVGAIVPIYVIACDISMLDNVWTLVVPYTAINLPIAVWMLRSFMSEVPTKVLEAARVDGASLVLLAGWVAQRYLVRELTLGAIK
jgi:sorbitol/mannitol transport system permease protein